jgi:hypothetical protein
LGVFFKHAIIALGDEMHKPCGNWFVQERGNYVQVKLVSLLRHKCGPSHVLSIWLVYNLWNVLGAKPPWFQDLLGN